MSGVNLGENRIPFNMSSYVSDRRAIVLDKNLPEVGK